MVCKLYETEYKTSENIIQVVIFLFYANNLEKIRVIITSVIADSIKDEVPSFNDQAADEPPFEKFNISKLHSDRLSKLYEKNRSVK